LGNQKKEDTTMKFRVLIGFTLLVLAANSASAHQREVKATVNDGVPRYDNQNCHEHPPWIIDGVPRNAVVCAPAVETPNQKHPLVFAFHGHGGNMQKTSSQMDFQTVWPEAVVVYPQGLKSRGVVNDTDYDNPQTFGWQIWPGAYGDRDVKFFDRMLETMRQKFAIDNNRVYAVGFSNGAYFCYVLWAERRTTLAAMGDVAGALWREGPTPTVLTGSLPVMQIAGIKDPEVTLAWQAETIETDQKINNAPMKQGEPCGDSCVLFPSSSQTPVKFWLHNGGHEYLTWMSAEFVKFFKNHQRT
jgi:polyhydroxybutyrate depolymerase